MILINSCAPIIGDIYKLQFQLIHNRKISAGAYEVTRIIFNSKSERLVSLTSLATGATYVFNWDCADIFGDLIKLECNRLYQSRHREYIKFKILDLNWFAKKINGTVYTLDKRVSGCNFTISEFCKNYLV